MKYTPSLDSPLLYHVSQGPGWFTQRVRCWAAYRRRTVRHGALGLVADRLNHHQAGLWSPDGHVSTYI